MIIDHARTARVAGFKMPDTKALLFRNPKAGMPFIPKPAFAIGLLSRILIYGKENENTDIVFIKMEYAAKGHKLESPVPNFDLTIERIFQPSAKA